MQLINLFYMAQNRLQGEFMTGDDCLLAKCIIG